MASPGPSSPQKNKTQKKTSLVTLYAPARAGRDRGAKTPYRIVMKFCAGVDVPDMITQAQFCGYRFRGFGDSGGQIFQFFIDFRLSSLKHSGTTVLACDIVQSFPLTKVAHGDILTTQLPG